MKWMNNAIVGCVSSCRRHTEALQKRSCSIVVSFFIPPKTVSILLNFTPTKLLSDLTAPQQSFRSMICISRCMGSPLKIFRSSAILEHWVVVFISTKKGNNYTPNHIFLRYVDRHNAEYWTDAQEFKMTLKVKHGVQTGRALGWGSN